MAIDIDKNHKKVIEITLLTKHRISVLCEDVCLSPKFEEYFGGFLSWIGKGFSIEACEKPLAFLLTIANNS